MTFVNGVMLIDAPASALNNSGEPILNARTDNTSAVKFIRANDGKTYPYVSAQAVRYWIRRTLEDLPASHWKKAPIRREDKVAYTDGNPIEWWDDDLFGYMRAPAKAESKKEAQEALTPLELNNKGKPRSVTRAAPLRISTFVSVAPVNITNDFGVMARQREDPVPFEHQFYRTTLHGLFSLDLDMAGKFYYSPRSGYQNLDAVRVEIARQKQLEHLEAEFAYRLPQAERIQRISSLLQALGDIQGGAKQSIHYTDVSPAVVICAVTRGGNHLFNYLFEEQRGVLKFQDDVFTASLADAGDRLLSPVYIGWKPGFSQQAQPKTDVLQAAKVEYELGTPRSVLKSLTKWISDNAAEWDK